MKKFIGLALATTLILTLVLLSISCAAAIPSNTPNPTATLMTTPTPTPTPKPTPSDTKPTRVEKMSIAEDFIKNSSTYKFDGIEGSLVMVKAETGLTSTRSIIFTFEYQTRHPGHGDRTGKILAQVITKHTAIIVVNTDQGKVVSANCDGTWDMLNDDANQKMALDFIKNSSTFKFDGIAESLKFIKSDPGPTSSFRSTSFTFEYQTAHPGHGDRTGQALDLVITKHTAVVLVNIEKGTVAWAVCDNIRNMVTEKDLPVMVSGIIVSGGDTTRPGGPLDAPRVFTYQIKQSDGSIINVSYTSYPPSPVGDAARAKITLDFNGGIINIGDKMEAYGMLNKQTHTIVVVEQGNYIRTSVPKIEVIGKVISGGDTTQPGGPTDAPRKFVYNIQKDDGTTVNVSYMAYPPSPVGDAAKAKITLSYYNGEPKAGDYMRAYGTYDYKTNTALVAEEGDFIKTYPQKP